MLERGYVSLATESERDLAVVGIVLKQHMFGTECDCQRLEKRHPAGDVPASK